MLSSVSDFWALGRRFLLATPSFHSYVATVCSSASLEMLTLSTQVLTLLIFMLKRRKLSVSECVLMLALCVLIVDDDALRSRWLLVDATPGLLVLLLKNSSPKTFAATP